MTGLQINKIGIMPAAAVLLLWLLLLPGCDLLEGESPASPGATPEATVVQPAPTADTTTGNVATGEVDVVAASPAGTADRGALVVVFSDAGNNPPLSQATVLLIDSAENRVIHRGDTSSGIYRTTLPPGTYDVAIVQDSIPVGGMVRPGIVVEEGATTTLTGYVAPEATLTVAVHQPDGSLPQQNYTIVLRSDGEEIYRREVKALTAETPLTLRTDVIYDVLIEYGDQTVGEEGVVIGEGESTISLTTPGQERRFQVGLTANGKPLTTPANVAVLDPESKVLFSQNEVKNMVDVVLPTGTEYTFRAQLRDQVVERPVNLDSGPLVPQILIDFQLP